MVYTIPIEYLCTSPYLEFLEDMEGLFHPMISEVKNLFAEASLIQMEVIMRPMELFSKASRQRVSTTKTILYFYWSVSDAVGKVSNHVASLR